MLCFRCGTNETIRAHLIPKVFCQEVQAGKSHATGIKEDGTFYPSQSGTFDKNILCATCDGKLGQLEDYVAQLCAAIRKESTYRSFGTKEVLGADKKIVLRFCAGILWKYSITAKEYGQIKLYKYQNDVSKIAYGEIEEPTWFDVAMFRLRVHKKDDNVFAYRAPLIDKKDRVRLYRFMLGGILFFVKVHQKEMREDALSNLWLSNNGPLRFAIVPAQLFEEFQIARTLAYSEPLSSFLDKQNT